GYGEPNSAIGETTDPDKRRQWTCWVAAHRVKTVPQDTMMDGMTKAPAKRLLVLEFELESDTFNPLYPVPNTPSVSRSDGSSPFSGSGTGIGSNSTPTEQTERNYSTPGSDSTSTPVVPDPAVAGDKVGDNTIATRPAPGEVEKPQAQEWFASAEAIIQSTTSRSRPLRSLERMRRFSRIGASLERTVATSGRGSGQGIGTMDVFTVLQEINEQLGKALDLLELLQIVVGVIKDLTQFPSSQTLRIAEAFDIA
ncbi:10069_t:CDS:1, partial [Acaulospora colombiana]